MKKNQNFLELILSKIEKVGNKLPDPASLFAIMAIATIFLSYIFSLLNVQALHPATQEVIKPFNLLSLEGIHRIILRLVKNFTDFVPLGTVLVAMIGIGVAEGAGLISTAIKGIVSLAPRKYFSFIVVFAGILSNMASEIGYVVLVPLAAILYSSVGRNPMVGMAAAFAGVSAGYSANLFLGTIDPLLAGLTEEAAHILDKNYSVNPAANYYFMVASTFFLAIIGAFVTDKIIDKRLNYSVSDSNSNESENYNSTLTQAEKRGLKFALLACLILFTIILIGIIPAKGFLRHLDTGSVLNSPLLKGIVAFIFLGGIISGISYGIGAGTIKSDKDAIKYMSKAISGLGYYIVLTFFAAQFTAYFNWTNIGLILAVNGSHLLQAINLGIIPTILLFILFSAFSNLLIGSASAKWAILAPIFVPMFMLVGLSPELTQCAYRIGDSVTNIISPMMSYFALIIVFFQKYNPKFGIGDLASIMIPYSFFFLIFWSALLVAWLLLGLPIGPGANIFYEFK